MTLWHQRHPLALTLSASTRLLLASRTLTTSGRVRIWRNSAAVIRCHSVSERKDLRQPLPFSKSSRGMRERDLDTKSICVSPKISTVKQRLSRLSLVLIWTAQRSM